MENETKEQSDRFFGMLLSTQDASLLGNILAGKGVLGWVMEYIELDMIANAASSFN